MAKATKDAFTHKLTSAIHTKRIVRLLRCEKSCRGAHGAHLAGVTCKRHLMDHSRRLLQVRQTDRRKLSCSEYIENIQ